MMQACLSDFLTCEDAEVKWSVQGLDLRTSPCDGDVLAN